MECQQDICTCQTIMQKYNVKFTKVVASDQADPVDPNDDTIKTGSKKGKRKSKYTGGLVLEPKKGTALHV